MGAISEQMGMLMTVVMNMGVKNNFTLLKSINTAGR